MRTTTEGTVALVLEWEDARYRHLIRLTVTGPLVGTDDPSDMVPRLERACRDALCQLVRAPLDATTLTRQHYEGEALTDETEEARDGEA